MPGCTIKYRNSSNVHLRNNVSDARMAMHVIEARDDLKDVELWENNERLCVVEPCNDGVWRVSK